MSSQVRGEASRDRQLVLVFADRSLWLDRERHDDLAVQALPDIRHEAATVTLQPALRQLLGKGGQIFAGCFIDPEVHELGGLGDQLGILCRKSRGPRPVMIDARPARLSLATPSRRAAIPIDLAAICETVSAGTPDPTDLGSASLLD